MSSRRPDKRAGAAGFVLVEVLVTAAVAAVLLAALVRAFSSTWGGIGAVREETEAMLVARAVIEASTPRNNLVPLAQEGVIGRYAWSVAIANTGIGMAAASADRTASGEAQPDQQRPFGSGPQGSPPLRSAGTLGRPGPDEGRRPGEPGGREADEAQDLPWTLFRIAVSVRAPSGRRTNLETFRLSRPAAPR